MAKRPPSPCSLANHRCSDAEGYTLQSLPPCCEAEGVWRPSLHIATRSEALAETCGTAKRQRIPSADGTALVWCPSRPHTTPLDVRVNRGAEPHRDDALHG
ncbi:hypothetical protein CIHG_00509 [Coccidioides immitis H538.4]|uniref:Uncharacterized protein n=2 Tax=Coccidioides immitis TaxID=5501 RepID=A0A0J8RFI3_COCIT|nr:hypothetical protein CIRG_07322 [Coccidioides immitis RMSCC 2394]KMU82729.1 hypothetical protein CIHG_00509 [Coccidioides immitis H538.4]